MKRKWQRYAELGVLLWAMGVVIQLLALAGQIDPSVDVRWGINLSILPVFAGSFFVALAYLFRSGGEKRWVGYTLFVLGTACSVLLLVFANALSDLLMPRVATGAMLLVHSFALIADGLVYPSFRKAVRMELDKERPS